MEKMISYLCNDLEVLKQDMGQTAVNFRTQNKINKYFAIMALLGGVYMVCNLRIHKNSQKEIEILAKKVEELKKMKGE
jgi:hypothetical protein